MAISASLATSWSTTLKVHDMMLGEGLQVTQSLAHQSALALLYESGDNAMEAVKTTLSFPAIEHVTIIDKSFSAILSEGKGKAVFPAHAGSIPGNAGLMREDDRHWYFIAPVRSTAEEDDVLTSLIGKAATKSELLGYVLVTMSKDQMRKIQASTFVNNMVIALFIATVLVVVLRLRLTTLTRPLDVLSEKMSQAEQGDNDVRASTEGPPEVARIAHAFNSMTEVLAERDCNLRLHNERLEQEVALRTLELVQARDVAEEASRNKSEFLSKMSHELRTPLQSIIGYTEVVRESLIDEGFSREVNDLERTLHNAEHLLSMINDILDLARIESGHIHMHVAPVNLRDVLKRAEEAAGSLIRKNKNTLSVFVEECQFPLMLDGGKLAQILINLLGNAAKFTKGGEIVVNATHTPDLLRISVQDTGIGIDAKQQTYVFDQFHQVDGSDTRRYQGSGLGLAITRQFCQLMGGDVQLESELGVGSIFKVTIPLIDPHCDR